MEEGVEPSEDEHLPQSDQKAHHLAHAATQEEVFGLVRHERIPQNRIVDGAPALSLSGAARSHVASVVFPFVLERCRTRRSINNTGPAVRRSLPWNCIIRVGRDAEDVHGLDEPLVERAEVAPAIRAVPDFGEAHNVLFQRHDLVTLQWEAVMLAVARPLPLNDLVLVFFQLLEERRPEAGEEVCAQHCCAADAGVARRGGEPKAGDAVGAATQVHAAIHFGGYMAVAGSFASRRKDLLSGHMAREVGPVLGQTTYSQCHGPSDHDARTIVLPVQLLGAEDVVRVPMPAEGVAFHEPADHDLLASHLEGDIGLA
mmetsp:Transcript_137595/g.294129  ORF Transcript_137595/g.294129 Transcript_137595/m.294129 type:complete len:314 (-) Transcript_137595:464-1405(-)